MPAHLFRLAPLRRGAIVVTANRGGLIDLKEICQRLNGMAEDLAGELLPRGRREGPYWIEAKTKHGGLGDSLKVDLRTGKWRWFAGDKFGDMLDLYSLVTNLDKIEAIKWAKDRLGISGRPSAEVRRDFAKAKEEADKRRAERQAQEAADLENARAAAKGIFLGAQPRLLGTPAGHYLEARGIELERLVRLDWGLHCLRFAPSLKHPYAKTYLPAMVALAIFPDGRTASLHRTYLVQRNGTWDRMREELDGFDGKLLYTKIHGGVIPLWRGSRPSKRGDGVVVRAEAYSDPAAGPDIRAIEGIENGLTCVQLDVDKRLVAAVSLGNLCQIKLPAGYKRRTWIRDNDDEGSAADELLDRALEAYGEGAEECFLVSPPKRLKDFNAGVMPAHNNKPVTAPQDERSTARPEAGA